MHSCILSQKILLTKNAYTNNQFIDYMGSIQTPVPASLVAATALPLDAS